MATLARFRWLVVATVFGSLVGLLGSYLLDPRYSASAVLRVQDPSLLCRGCVLPDESVTQQKLANYLQQVLSLNNLRPLIERERLARPGDFEKVYWETHKKIKLEVGGDVEPEVDLVYTDSTPQRAKEFCEILTSAFEERTRIDSEAHSMPSSNVGRGPVAISILGEPAFYQVGVVLPCAYATIDLSHVLVYAALGSATGLLIGTAMIAARRKSLGQLAKPRGC